jgi:heptosyltransferase III
MSESAAAPRILVIRRDNIGDLVCTTPTLRALRAHYPQALLCVLVNSYNVAVLDHHSDIDQVFAYTKAKHRPPGQSVLSVYIDRLRLIARLRRMRFDYVILAGPGLQERSLRFARAIAPRHIVGFTDDAKPKSRLIDIGIAYRPVPQPIHEVEDTFRLLAALGIDGPPPSLRVVPAAERQAQARLSLGGLGNQGKVIGVHISARKPSQRWPVGHFVELIAQLCREPGARVVLFWSPGDSANPLHPGDDAKAQAILRATEGLAVTPWPTAELGELIAGLSVCDWVICSDGGAMHVAAGLGKPILCFFGKSESTRWYPWGVPYVLLQPPSLEVSDISVAEALAGVETLLTRVRQRVAEQVVK